MKLEIKEYRLSEIDRAHLVDLFLKLRQLKTKNKKQNEIQTEQIKQIREEISSYGFVFYKPLISLGKHKVSLPWSNEFQIGISKDLLREKRAFFRSIKDKRRDNKKLESEEKNYTYYNYSTVGGTFTKPNSILLLKNSAAPYSIIDKAKAPHPKSRINYIGVEIECIIKGSKQNLKDKLVEKDLFRYVNLKNDGSIRTSSTHTMPVEITVMAEENIIKDIIEKLCKVLRLKSIDATVNNSCGLHVHLDMRNRNVNNSYRGLFKSLNILSMLVTSNRRSKISSEASFCKKNLISSFENQLSSGGRYFAINAQSFTRFKTLEVRLHGGTTNAEKINNWIDILKTIVSSEEIPQISFRSINTFCKFYNINNSLRQFMSERAAKLSNKEITTNVDEQVA